MSLPKFEQPPLDPAYAGLMAQSKADKLAAVQERVQFDTSDILARYGANLALAGSAAPVNGAPPPGTRA